MAQIDSWRYAWQNVPWKTTQLLVDDSSVSHINNIEICSLRLISDVDCLVWLSAVEDDVDITQAFLISDHEELAINSHGVLAFCLHAQAANSGESGTLYVTRLSPVSGV